MTRSLLLILFLLIYSNLLFAQKNIIALNAIIGDTIDKNEKEIFYLFPEIEDSSYVYGQIFKDSNQLWSLSILESDTVVSEIDSLKIESYRNNINKLIAYHIYLSKKDSAFADINNLLYSDSIGRKANSITYTPTMRKKLRKDAQRYTYLKGKAEEIGLWGVDKDNYIQTSSFIGGTIYNPNKHKDKKK